MGPAPGLAMWRDAVERLRRAPTLRRLVRARAGTEWGRLLGEAQALLHTGWRFDGQDQPHCITGRLRVRPWC